MARVKLNPALATFLGQLGELVFKMRYGKMYASRKPEARPHVFTAAQKAAQGRFREATRYAKRVMADPEARVAYDMAAKEKDAPVQSVIIADFLRSPSIDEMDLTKYDGRAGSAMRIRASDDFDVVSVEVVISMSTGEVIERGMAILSSMKWGSWIYRATATVATGTRITVAATATDRPGNTSTKSVETQV